MVKIKILIRNNHWREGFLPCDLEGEKHSTITENEFEKGLSQYPEIKDKIEYLVDWDEDNYISSMKEADVLLGWQFPTNNIREIAPNLKWIHVSSAGVNHLSPFDWMKDDLILTNSSGVHSKKAGEFGLMSILMLQNQMTKIITNKKHKKYGGNVFRSCLKLCCISPSSTMMHRSIFTDFGFFDEDLPACEDYDYWLRYSAKEDVIFIDEPLIIKYGGHKGQLSYSIDSIECHRIKALEYLLSTSLSKENRDYTIQMLISKISIYLNGLIKRGKKHEIAVYEEKIKFWNKFSIEY